MLRPIALALLLVSVPAFAQSAGAPAASCSGGVAVHNGRSFPCNGVDLMARVPLSTFLPNAPSIANEVWGWTDPVTGQEIALVGLSNGVGFVDVSTPEAPVYLGKLTSATSGNNDWRSMRTDGDYLFVGSEASGHGIQVFDLTRLRGAAVPTTFTHDARYRRVGNTHTLEANNGYLYLSGNTSTSGAVSPVCTSGGLHIVDVRDPLNPVFAGCYSGDGYTHEAQCLTYSGPDTRYTGRDLCFAYQGQEGAFTGDVSIVDMTNKAAPVRIGVGDYPNVGYSHQGWLTPDGKRLLINDEFDRSPQGARTIVMNVSDLQNPEFEFNYYSPVATYAHNLYIVGNHAYLSNYTSGLRIVNLGGLESGVMNEVASFDTYDQSNGYSYNGQWMNYPFFASGTIVATDIQNGLFVLRWNGMPVAADAPAGTVTDVLLSAPSPNPTADRATLTLALPTPERVRAVLLDGLGREVAVLFDGAAAGTTTLTAHTQGLAAGLYVVRVTGETFAVSRHLSVAR